MDMNHEINRLINFGQQNNLLTADDIMYTANLLCADLKLKEYSFAEVDEQLPTATPILENMLDYAAEQGLIENTVTERDLFDTKLMNNLMMRPSEVIRGFKEDYKVSPELATDNYYKLSIASNYIRKDRIDKNIIWQADTEYGKLDITVNLSKPEKDPKEIAKTKLVKASSYPKCLLCRENEGFAGTFNHPARQTHRLLPLELNEHQWFMQYSPYTYYNEHCIVLNSIHQPMRIDRTTFANLLAFLDYFPHYFIGSNADLPIVGGSILSHDHYQGGRYTFAMAKAPLEKKYTIKGFEDIEVGRIKWPMSALRLIGSSKERLIELAEHILQVWRGYSDVEADILAETDEPHNTVTPIARCRDGKYELDIVMRNNRTTDEYPLGIFHPHNEVHHIKKENIGLIEVMGLAVLPARLKTELSEIRQALLDGVKDISDRADIALHADWYRELVNKYPVVTAENAENIIRKEVGIVFMQVLTHAGVFKRNAQGMAAFDRFVAAL